MLDSKNPSGKSFTQVNDALFYSNDTDAHLVFLPHEQEEFEFNEATVALYNIDDESLVERPATIETFEGRKSVVLKMTEDLLVHWGRWQAQVVFKQGDKINTSVVVKFDTLRYMLDQRPPTLRDVIKVDELYSQLVTVMDEIAGKDVISAPEIILARGGFDTLGERLDDTTAQLAQTKQAFNDSVSLVTEDSEVILARDGKTTLGVRLDDIESGNGLDNGAITIDKLEPLISGFNNFFTKFGYSNGLLTRIREYNEDGSRILRETNITYDSNNNLTAVSITQDGKTVKSTLNYANGSLDTVTNEMEV